MACQFSAVLVPPGRVLTGPDLLMESWKLSERPRLRDLRKRKRTTQAGGHFGFDSSPNPARGRTVWSTPIEHYWRAFNGTQLGGSSPARRSASRPLYPSHAAAWVSSYVLMGPINISFGIAHLQDGLGSARKSDAGGSDGPSSLY